MLFAALDALAHPPPSSWVPTIATTFRFLALLVILPCILLTALDVASYLIVRTLGPDSAHEPGRHQAPEIQIASPCGGGVEGDGGSGSGSGSGSEEPAGTSTWSNPALSGEGVFSPAPSRSSSPPIARSNSPNPHRARGACLGGSLAMTGLPAVEPDGTSLKRRNNQGDVGASTI